MEFNVEAEQYEFLIQRDFRAELQMYFKQKQDAEKQKLKEKQSFVNENGGE